MRIEYFKTLEEAGYISEYVRRAQNGEWIPDITLDWAKEVFAGKGDRVKYLGKNGYPIQQTTVESFGINSGDEMTVKFCHIGRTTSYYAFEEIPESHNTVMFERI